MTTIQQRLQSAPILAVFSCVLRWKQAAGA